MNIVASKQSSCQGIAIRRDKNDNPKLDKNASIKFWDLLDAEDRTFLKEKYSLDLEVNDNG